MNSEPDEGLLRGVVRLAWQGLHLGFESEGDREGLATIVRCGVMALDFIHEPVRVDGQLITKERLVREHERLKAQWAAERSST